jgi:hypothetical protein
VQLLHNDDAPDAADGGVSPSLAMLPVMRMIEEAIPGGERHAKACVLEAMSI